MKRLIVALLVGGALFAAAFGAAAMLDPVNGGVIQAGTDGNLTCDRDGVQVLGWGLNSMTGLVENVRIGGVADACAGAGLQARITLSDGTQYITGPAAGQYEVPIVTPQPANGYRLLFMNQAGVLQTAPAYAIVALDVFIEGPTP